MSKPPRYWTKAKKILSKKIPSKKNPEKYPKTLPKILPNCIKNNLKRLRKPSKNGHDNPPKIPKNSIYKNTGAKNLAKNPVFFP